MAYTIKFENDDGTIFETPVIEDTERGRRRPSVIEGEDPELIPPEYRDLKKTKKKTKKKRVV
tara:strand:- start:450 stop:635 length:186 start_codon:yes stop_codon:yes gene_type:complete